MNRKFLIYTLTAFCFHFSVFGITGKEIVEKAKSNIQHMKSQSLPNTARVRMTMVIQDNGESIEREFDIMSKRYGEKEGKLLISFIRPSTMKILAHAHKDGKQDIWMKMSSGKIRKVSIDDERPLPILSDSHFTFEDFNVSGLGNLGVDIKNLNFNVNALDAKLDNFEFTYLGDKKVGDSMCYVVESVLKKKEFQYNKVNYYFRKTDFNPMRIDFFKNNTFYKYLELNNMQTVDGYRLPFQLVMTMANGKDRTILKIVAIKLNSEISNSKFSRGAL